MDYCKEQEYIIDAVPCTRCGHCEEIYYADTEQESELCVYQDGDEKVLCVECGQCEVDYNDL